MSCRYSADKSWNSLPGSARSTTHLLCWTRSMSTWCLRGSSTCRCVRCRACRSGLCASDQLARPSPSPPGRCGSNVLNKHFPAKLVSGLVVWLGYEASQCFRCRKSRAPIEEHSCCFPHTPVNANLYSQYPQSTFLLPPALLAVQVHS